MFDPNKPAIVNERKQDQAAPRFSRKRVGSILPKVSGGKVYEYDPNTGTIQEAQCEKDTAKIVQKAGCIYVEAINEKNALRKARGGKVITVVKPSPKISRTPNLRHIGYIDHIGHIPFIF